MVMSSNDWRVMKNGTKEIKTFKQLDFPDQLDLKCLEQLNKVYTSCIHPTQFLPQQFTEDNAESILQSGPYAAEKLLPYSFYTSLGPPSILQHCRYNRTIGMYNLLYLKICVQIKIFRY